MSVTFLSDLMSELGQRGRNLLLRGRETRKSPEELCEALVSQKGQISCFVLSEAIFDHWEKLDESGREAFLTMIAERLGPDREAIMRAVDALKTDADMDALYRVHRASEPRVQELIRRLNHASNGTQRLVRMREALLSALETKPSLKNLDGDFSHLFTSWFNRGFLELLPINWDTSASVLEKIIRYEAVHEITGWDDLRRRIEPRDRRLFAFFHPQMRDEPLIFVEVALTDHVPDNIGSLLATGRAELDPRMATTAVFYSISNCQKGLRGISFGNFLIKQVVDKLRAEFPNLRNFVTLSPVPGFAVWLDGVIADRTQGLLSPQDVELLSLIDARDWQADTEGRQQLGALLESLAAFYFLEARDPKGRPLDPVARFHLGNGACLDNIHAFADLSDKGRSDARTLMVNYRYATADIETNHEAYAERGIVVASSSVKGILRKFMARARNNQMLNHQSQEDHVA
ncbi:MAG: malonyl-CoA decarboxylase [Rhizobiaceae bacterium]|nr:malonyl-CoA decarboxylase [Rhizobiaceae bacterium]